MFVVLTSPVVVSADKKQYGPLGSNCRSSSPRLIAGERRFVHFIDLIGIEKLLRIAQIHLLAHKYIEEIGIDVSVGLGRNRVMHGLARY